MDLVEHWSGIGGTLEDRLPGSFKKIWTICIKIVTWDGKVCSDSIYSICKNRGLVQSIQKRLSSLIICIYYCKNQQKNNKNQYKLLTFFSISSLWTETSSRSNSKFLTYSFLTFKFSKSYSFSETWLVLIEFELSF